MADETADGEWRALTPAEVEILQQMIAERHADAAGAVQAAIDAAVAPLAAQVEALTQQVATLQETLTVLDGAAVKVGDQVALRAQRGQLLSATDGGPKESHELFEFESRVSQGDWESFTLERR